MSLAAINPFNYSLDQVKAAVVTAVGVIVMLVGFFVILDPGTTATWTAVVTGVFMVIGAFAAKNPTPDSINKSLTAAVVAIIGVLQLYGTDVDEGTVEKIGILIGALVPAIAALLTRNSPDTPERALALTKRR